MAESSVERQRDAEIDVGTVNSSDLRRVHHYNGYSAKESAIQLLVRI